MENPGKFDVDLALLQKYNQPGPRYTSYPTAPQFHSGFQGGNYEEAIAVSNRENPEGELSLYFHLPFCHSLCYFCGCNMIVTRNAGRVERYLTYLRKEIDLVSKQINPRREVVQLHWGGGTPTYLSPAQIREIFSYIRDHFRLAADAEISIEIDPRRLAPDHLSTLREVGFNRVSFGVQDFHPEVQQAINRIQSDEQNRYVIEESRRLGFDSINVDLIYGLPFQTLDSYEQTLDQVIELSPDRLAVFNYAHVPWMKKHQQLLPEAEMPSAADRLRLLKLIIERLTEAGYVYIGMDHFAKPEDELTEALHNHTLHRNFQGYSTRAGAEVFAMGITSISQLNNVYAQNVKDIKTYEEMLDRGELPTHVGYQLSEDDHIRRFVITELMCNNRLRKADVHDRFGIDFDDYFAAALPGLAPFIEDELLSVFPDRIQVHEDGRLVIRNIAMVFDAYLQKDRAQAQPIYSRTV